MTSTDETNDDCNSCDKNVSSKEEEEKEEEKDDCHCSNIQNVQQPPENFDYVYPLPERVQKEEQFIKGENVDSKKSQLQQQQQQQQQQQRQQQVPVDLTAATASAAKLNQSFADSERPRNVGLYREGGLCHFVQSMERKRVMYIVVGVAMAACVIFIIIASFAPKPIGLLSADCPCVGPLDRCICPRPTVEALTYFQMFCLANSRVAAYVCYPLYLLMFLTMTHNINTWFKTKLISEFFPVEGMHHLHVWSGTVIGILVTWHALWHLIRWGVQGNLPNLLFHTQTGWTGLVAILITPLLVLPMKWEYLRTRMPFELRKGAHYLSWVWAIMLMKHAPARNVFWIVGSAFLLYLLDWLYGYFVTTFLVPSARFVRMESAIMIKMKKPKSFPGGVCVGGNNGGDINSRNNQNGYAVGGYCYICLPWISRFEWHAFSVFQDPTDDQSICFIIAVTGNWTKALHRSITEPVYRRVWISGPFTSPFETATDSDQVISVASGIGITAALSVIEGHAHTRKMHLIWMCRDASLLEFIMDYGARFDVDAYTFIFYTGKRELVFKRPIPYNVFLLSGRPDLEQLIVSIGLLAEQQSSGGLKTLEELGITNSRVMSLQKDIESTLAEHLFYAEITRLLMTYSIEELFNAAVRRSHRHGPVICYEGLRDLVSDIFWKKMSEENLKRVFDHVDKDRNGEINAQEFINFIKEMEDEARYRREDYNNKEVVTLKLTENVSQNSALKSKVRFDHFRILYCGGSQPVVKALQEISSAHKIPLELESFAW